MRSLPRRTSLFLLPLVAAMLATPVVARDEPLAEAPATALRVALARALGEHALLLGEVVRSGIADAPDFGAAAASLEANSNDLIAAIEDVYGDEAGTEFAEQWRNHVAYIVDYARARAGGDEDAAQLASDQLARYVADFSRFLADALPALPPDAVEGLIGEHVQQLQHVASFDENDYGGAYSAIRETYAHMFDVGDGLTTGIIGLYPGRFTGRHSAFSPATDLRVKLDLQLGEHSYLAAMAMRAVLRGAEDADSAADALSANSDDLRETIGEVYGPEARTAFGRLWRTHVIAYMAYVTALEDDDEAAADAALEKLAEYKTDFSAYVAEANPFLTSVALEALIGAHTDHLVAQADAYATGDYEASYQLGREAYAHAGEIGRSLAGAIAAQFPQLFPDTSVGVRPATPVVPIGAAVLAVIALLAGVRIMKARRASTPPAARRRA